MSPRVAAITDGIITIRTPVAGDAAILVAGRDEVFHRWMGTGSDDPDPAACIVIDGAVVGWIDYDQPRPWLETGEVNIGYHLFAAARGRSHATRAVQLLMHHLAMRTRHHTATLLIDPDNAASLAVAERAAFHPTGIVNGQRFFKRAVPATTYSDGTVTIRRQSVVDLDADLEAKDDEQIDWLWLPGQRQLWEAKTTTEQREHARRGLEANERNFGSGPSWNFAGDAAGAPYAVFVNCDLANEHVPHGEANISYSSHPAHRGRGYVSRAVRLVMQFLHDHTGAREAHIIADVENAPSLRVAQAVDAVATERWVNDQGRTMQRHVAVIPRP